MFTVEAGRLLTYLAIYVTCFAITGERNPMLLRWKPYLLFLYSGYTASFIYCLSVYLGGES